MFECDFNPLYFSLLATPYSADDATCPVEGSVEYEDKDYSYEDTYR